MARTMCLLFNMFKTRKVLDEDQDHVKDTKKLWTFIEHIQTDSVGIVATVTEKGELKDTHMEKAHILHAQFKYVF